MTFDPGHGTQVAYFSPDGTEYLWYPGNRVIVKASYELRRGKSTRMMVRTADGLQPREAAIHDICFKYGSNTYNPVTKRGGGKWECRAVLSFNQFVRERMPSDVFGLSRRTAVPFELSRAKTSLQSLKARCTDC